MEGKKPGHGNIVCTLIKPCLNPFPVLGLSAILVNKFCLYLNHFGLDFLTFAIKRMVQLLRISIPSLLSFPTPQMLLVL